MSRYWIVDGDKGNTVHMLELGQNDFEPERLSTALTRLLNEPAPELD